MTSSLIKALLIIKNHKPNRPVEFARLMWPDSECWLNSVKCGKNGTSVGGGMNLAAGGYLRKLQKTGYLQIRHTKFGNLYFLTEKSERLLDSENSNS